MIEYLGNAIRAFAGSEISIAMAITDATGTPITTNCKLNFRDKDRTLIKSYEGTYYENDKVWNFIIPREDTEGLSGRYWYSVQYDKDAICFTQPLYFC